MDRFWEWMKKKKNRPSNLYQIIVGFMIEYLCECEGGEIFIEKFVKGSYGMYNLLSKLIENKEQNENRTNI